jgi:2-methylcitrate dehydratase PrpD
MALPSVTPYLAGLAAKIDGVVSADDLTKAETCLLDWCAVALAATDDPLMRLMRDQAAAEGGHPQAGFLGTTARGSAAQAALVNGTASHLYDYDDGATSIPGHPTVPVGSAVWALGEREGASGRAVLTAFILGVEVMCRLGRALRPNHYAAGWHASGTLGAIGAAVACAKLLGLDAERTAWAMGLAACRASGLKAVFGSSAKPLQLGHAAALGLQSTDLAARGFDCTPDVLETAKGFLELHAPSFDLKPVTAPLDAPLAIREVRFKRHAACFLTHAPAEASLAFKRAHNDAAETIKRIRLVGNPEVRTVCGNWTPNSGLAFKFSAPMVVAAALSGVDTGALSTFNEQTARDPKLRALAAKVEIETDATLGQDHARLTFETVDGKTYDLEGGAGQGPTDAASDRAALLPKVRALVRPLYGEAATESLIAAFGGLHAAARLPDIAPLSVRAAAE